MDGHHSRVIDPRGRSRLPQDACDAGGAGPAVGFKVLGEVRLFEGDLPVDQRVAPGPHRTHTARAELLGEPVAAGDQPSVDSGGPGPAPYRHAGMMP